MRKKPKFHVGSLVEVTPEENQGNLDPFTAMVCEVETVGRPEYGLIHLRGSELVYHTASWWWSERQLSQSGKIFTPRQENRVWRTFQNEKDSFE